MFEATDFIAAIAQHIPDKGFQMVKYYGYYSSKARGLRAKTSTSKTVTAVADPGPCRRRLPSRACAT